MIRRQSSPTQPSYSSLPLSTLVGRPGLLQWIREHLNKCNITGSYFEFGVFNGSSMMEAYFLLKDQVDSYIGFDSFKGLPRLSDIDQKDISKQPQFVEGNLCSNEYSVVKEMILSTCLAEETLCLVEGYFKESLTKELQEELLSKTKASVVHLDVDLYSSTREALDFIYPFLQTGTWLLCDDYWTYAGSSSCGTQKALNEFLKDHSDIKIQEYCSYKGWAKSFIVEKL